ncbi:unnamed protein product [Dimorphilus gyrociliatus]|uniref:Uncharacterized protein n=1 Tax=Dimorphilus gyrociliatus TaxID=2664684 RepID=A0A7I8WCL4_9ANNE|nr:unnamed protein product [Dimorphilus gyrociliatus]
MEKNPQTNKTSSFSIDFILKDSTKPEKENQNEESPKGPSSNLPSLFSPQASQAIYNFNSFFQHPQYQPYSQLFVDNTSPKTNYHTSYKSSETDDEVIDMTSIREEERSSPGAEMVDVDGMEDDVVSVPATSTTDCPGKFLFRFYSHSTKHLLLNLINLYKQRDYKKSVGCLYNAVWAEVIIIHSLSLPEACGTAYVYK